MPELKDDATHEDIEKYVDDIVSQMQDESSEEEPQQEVGDSAKIASETDKPVGDMTADTGSDDTVTDSDQSVEDETTGEEDWLTDDLKAEVAAYGIDEETLAEFTSREELERALRVFDKTLLEAGRKAMASDEESKEDTARDEQGRFQKQESQDGKFEITLDKEVFDEDLVNEITRMRDHYESRIDALESRFHEADARAEEQHFDSVVDSLGHADLFGKSGNENSKQLKRRQDVFLAFKEMEAGAKSVSGRVIEMNDITVGRMARMLFAEEIGKKELKQKTQKLAKQTPSHDVNSSKSPDQPESVREEMRRLYAELENA